MDIKQQTGQPGEPSVAAPVPEELSSKALARRRFSKAGIGSGLVVTLASQPGMASSVCKPPSGCYSKGLINSHKAAPSSSGMPPEDWCNTANWPSPCSRTRLFGADFSCRSSSYRNAKSLDILNSKFTSTGSVQNTDQMKIARLCATALLNVKANRSSSFLTDSVVKALWHDYDSYGYYKPNASAKWYASDILFYLTGTMDRAAMNVHACDRQV